MSVGCIIGMSTNPILMQPTVITRMQSCNTTNAVSVAPPEDEQEALIFNKLNNRASRRFCYTDIHFVHQHLFP
jgi:hypothetical protein